VSADDTLIITVQHVRKNKLCTRGARLWFISHGLSWDDFVTNGISASRLRGTRDVLCESTIAIAKAEHDGR
jgi:hypothetical protein